MILDWVQYVRREVHINNYSPSIVVSMDETNVDFDIMAKSTLDVRGAISINVKSMGSSDRFPQDLVYAVQPKAWNDADMMKQWIDLIWCPFCIEKGPPACLIWDEFSMHLMRKTIHAVQDSCTQVGYTGAVHILDKGVNKPFKDYIRKRKIQFMIDNPNRKPKQQHVARWIKASLVFGPGYSGDYYQYLALCFRGVVNRDMKNKLLCPWVVGGLPHQLS